MACPWPASSLFQRQPLLRVLLGSRSGRGLLCWAGTHTHSPRTKQGSRLQPRRRGDGPACFWKSLSALLPEAHLVPQESFLLSRGRAPQPQGRAKVTSGAIWKPETGPETPPSASSCLEYTLPYIWSKHMHVDIDMHMYVNTHVQT